uniref:Uncharacterized protein n=1 Tax=Arundo donax TaxID=35708 RepID=A0A0A9AZX4_ARUDO
MALYVIYMLSYHVLLLSNIIVCFILFVATCCPYNLSLCACSLLLTMIHDWKSTLERTM